MFIYVNYEILCSACVDKIIYIVCDKVVNVRYLFGFKIFIYMVDRYIVCFYYIGVYWNSY